MVIMSSRPFTTVLGCAFVLLFSSSVGAAEAIGSVEELRALRKEAANRQRRIIFNNDGNEPVYLCKGTTAEELLSYRTTPLLGSQVDSLFYCTWSSGFGLFTHDTKVGQVFATKEGLFANNRTPELLAAGTDPLRVMTDFGQKHGLEVFWSFRLNDTHDGSIRDYGPIMFQANQLKVEHPEWLIEQAGNKPKFGAWSAVDFTHAEIRDLAFRYTEEVCRNYPVDGVELDFFRHPVFFKRPAVTGTECNDVERALMTDLMRRIRTMTETEGMRRGKPILIAMRVPDSVEFCRAVGIDLEAWLKEGLLDLLITSGYFQLNDWSYSVALGHRHGVKVYPSLDESRVKDPAAKKLRSSVASYRGRALNAWKAGADGVYLFNSFNPNNAIWREMGSPDQLARLDQDYFASVRGLGAAAGGTYPHEPFVHIPTLNATRPTVVQTGEEGRISLTIGNDLAGTGAVVKLRLQFKEPAGEAVIVKLNNAPLSGGKWLENWLEFDLAPETVKAGAQAVTVSLASAAKVKRVTWTDLHCTVRFPKTQGR